MRAIDRSRSRPKTEPHGTASARCVHSVKQHPTRAHRFSSPVRRRSTPCLKTVVGVGIISTSINYHPPLSYLGEALLQNRAKGCVRPGANFYSSKEHPPHYRSKHFNFSGRAPGIGWFLQAPAGILSCSLGVDGLASRRARPDVLPDVSPV